MTGLRGTFLGLATLDVQYLVTGAVGVNQKVRAVNWALAAGGPATNAAVTFAALGGEPTLLTALGQRGLGSVAARDIVDNRVNLVDCAKEDGEIPVSSVIVQEADGQRAVVSMNDQVLRMQLDEDELGGSLAASSVLLVDGHYGPAAVTAAERARSRGVPVVMDGGSWKDVTADLLPHVDVAICSADFKPPGLEDGSVPEMLLDAGVTFVAVSRGDRATEWHSREGSGEIPVPRVQAVDTAGAGDVLHGAFAFGAAQMRSAEKVMTTDAFADILQHAMRLATETCRYFGTRSWISSGVARQWGFQPS